jgi:hypothetical protein
VSYQFPALFRQVLLPLELPYTPLLIDLFIIIYLFIFALLGFELRAYTLSHSASPFL